jgi:hypothetical protein
VEEERHGRKRAETRSAYLEDENYRLRAAGLTPAPVQPPAPPAPAAEDDDGPLSWYSFGKR